MPAFRTAHPRTAKMAPSSKALVVSHGSTMAPSWHTATGRYVHRNAQLSCIYAEAYSGTHLQPQRRDIANSPQVNVNASKRDVDDDGDASKNWNAQCHCSLVPLASDAIRRPPLWRPPAGRGGEASVKNRHLCPVCRGFVYRNFFRILPQFPVALWDPDSCT